MKRILFASLPALVSLGYMFVEFAIYSAKGRMLFSDTFLPEWMLYLFIGALYLFFGYRIGRLSYLRVAILGLCIGFIVFTVVGYQLFLHFEFANNLSL
jgi:hypothetical protein